MFLLACGYIAICCMAFANGSNDISRAAATLVGSGIASYQKSLRWGIVWTFVGSLLSGVIAGGVAQRLAASLAETERVNPLAVYGVASGAILWVAGSSFKGLPVSTTHALLGSILAMNWLARGAPPWGDPSVLKGFVIPLLSSPVISLACLFAFRAASDKTIQLCKSRDVLVDRANKSIFCSVDRGHWISSGLVGMSRGINDSAKIWALIIPLIATAGTANALLIPAAVVLVAVSMAFGSWLAGQRVTELLAHRITKMSPEEGLFANATTALVITIASFLGFPVASSHVIGGAIIGVGLTRLKRAVNWQVVSEMVLSWVCTLPGAGLSAAVCYSLSPQLFSQALVKEHSLGLFVFVGAVFLIALVLLSAAPIRLMFRRRARAGSAPITLTQRLFLFVCGSNTSRSPMAQAICNAEIAERLKIPRELLQRFGVEALSAGLSAKPETPMTPEAQDALQEIGITGVMHTARQLNAEMVNRAEAVFCMTEEQCAAVVAMCPHAAPKVYRLNSDADIDDPSGKGQTAFISIAGVLKSLISERLNDLAIARSAPAN
jgi:inorganic phosphate transporter, PiT family